MSYPPWLPGPLRSCGRKVCREHDCKITVDGPPGRFFLVRIDGCLDKIVPELADKHRCDCAVVCEDTVCLIEIKCGEVRAGFEREVKPQLDETEAFLKESFLPNRVYKRLVCIKRYGSPTIKQALLTSALKKRIKVDDILTTSRRTFSFRASGFAILVKFTIE